jgi:hypothetical protein
MLVICKAVTNKYKEKEIVDIWLFDTKIMLRSVWKKKAKKKGGNVGHDPMYLCFYDHNFPYVVRHFNFENSWTASRTRVSFLMLLLCGLVKLIEYCFDHQIFVILKLTRKYIMFIFLAAVVNQSSHLTSISAASLWKT